MRQTVKDCNKLSTTDLLKILISQWLNNYELIINSAGFIFNTL